MRLRRRVGLPPSLIATPANALAKISLSSSVPSPFAYTKTPFCFRSWMQLRRTVGLPPSLITTPENREFFSGLQADFATQAFAELCQPPVLMLIIAPDVAHEGSRDPTHRETPPRLRSVGRSVPTRGLEVTAFPPRRHLPARTVVTSSGWIAEA
jgi:hypothetical protein